MVPEEVEEPQDRCELCGEFLEESGDDWRGLCAECADVTSAYRDEHGLNDEQRSIAIRALRRPIRPG